MNNKTFKIYLDRNNVPYKVDYIPRWTDRIIQGVIVLLFVYALWLLTQKSYGFALFEIGLALVNLYFYSSYVKRIEEDVLKTEQHLHASHTGRANFLDFT